ncbi:SPOR domain-containing protein [Novosphingobium cyanobacteriorum]|uniref:SPOR domain-containing protein n=1 Tax=Novosphingobium cyanobacteriorum TaxID=3024215 RepID=A0ABT6CEY8_9SPHN|nr:SPOR domain-containing protein [Novosphingobium cyanobacteriorum]MDF8331893.1 SPOR domain-containing protein [Novosphingobium cyanobacteriorum]
MKSAASLLASTAMVVAALALPAGQAVAGPQGMPAGSAQPGPQGDYPVTIGDPFTVEGVTYTPADTMNYDAVGYASATDGSGITGSHRTLPLPCYVEVTSLENGHTILVRLDRRGPMAGGKDQLVELSAGAWAQLGLPGGSRSPVRVRRVNPPETERALLRAGQTVPARMDTPPGLLAALKRKLGLPVPPPPPLPDEIAKAVTTPVPTTRPAGIPARPVGKPPVAAPQPEPKAEPKPEAKLAPKPAPKPEPKPAPAPKPPAPRPATTSAVSVQVGAFSTRERAEKAAAQVGGSVSPAGKYFRVRIGASSPAEAQAALAKARGSGYADARIVRGQ